MQKDNTLSMPNQLIQQGRAFFVVSLITLQLAAQYWGTNAPGEAIRWWVPVVWFAGALAVTLFIILRRRPKLRLGPIIFTGILVLAIISGGYALSSRSLDYRYFLGLSAALFLVAMVSCASIYWPHISKAFKKPLGILDNWTSLLLLVGLLVGIIRTLADMEKANINAWGTTPLLLVAILVAFFLTMDFPLRSVPSNVPRTSPGNTVRMFEEYRRERLIRKTLRRLSQQRVRGILQPGNVWVIEKAVIDKSEDVTAALSTCLLRGWVEVLSTAVPHEELTPEGKLPEGPLGSRVAPVYRITQSGWNIIHRSHEWVLVTCAVAGTTLIATIIGIFIKS